MENRLWRECYGTLSVLNIFDSEIRDWDIGQENSFIKVVLPSKREAESIMKKLGYTKIDTRFDCCVNIKKFKEKYNYRFRIERDYDDLYGNEIFSIAKQSFNNDPRFNFLMDYSKKSYELILKEYIQCSKYKFICIHGDKIVGFILLHPKSEKVMEVKLAAVLSEYKIRGVGIEFYFKAIDFCLESKFEFLYGSIETINLSAVNLYSYIKAEFVAINDTYLKKVENNGT